MAELSAYLIALGLSLASVGCGAAICGSGGSWSWAAPPVGLAALTIIALVAIRLPGHGTTAAVAIGLALVASMISIRRRHVPLRPALVGVPVAAAVTAACSIPFLANDVMGELGASVLDDLIFHLGQADAMRTLGSGADVIAAGYPTGPHAIVAALADGTGAGISNTFTGLLIAVPVVTALTALALLEGRWYVRALGASLTGLPYLASGYFAQGAFKELMMALFFLGFVVVLRDVHRSRALEARSAIALVLIAAGGVAAFGTAALVWPAAALAWLAGLELATRRRAILGGWPLRRAGVVFGGAVVAAAALALTAWSGDFFDSGPGQFLTKTGTGGNYVGQLNPLEALGVWPNPDFRYSAAGRAMFVPGVAIAVAAVLYGALWCWRRREWALLAGGAAAVSVYLVARPLTLAYFSGKALMIAAPMLTLIGLTALTAAGSERNPAIRRLAAALVVAFVALSGYSSALALRGAYVRPSERGPDLAAFRSVVDGERALYLGRDNYAGWELRGADLWGFAEYSTPLQTSVSERPAKSAGDQDRPAVDADSVDPGFMDGFRYLITPRTAYASRPPVNYRRIRKTPWHELWERSGPTQPRWSLDEGEAPGAVLDCRRREMRRLAQLPGMAFTRSTPVTGRVDAWRAPGGARPTTPGATQSGGRLVQRLGLPPGSWNISFRYFSTVPVHFRAGSLKRELPAYMGDRSSFVTLGRITSRGGGVPVEVKIPERKPIAIVRTVLLGTVAATRTGDRGHRVPLRRACGKYVDWFTFEAGR